MRDAALLLALATLVTPTSARHRISRGRWRPPRPVVPIAASAVVALLATVVETGVLTAVTLVGVAVVVRRRRRRRQQRRAAEATALQGALDVLVAELRVGAHPVAAFSIAAEEVDGVVCAAMRMVAARARMGADVVAGMRAVADRSMLPAHWERLAVCWHLAQAHGLGIASLVQTAQHDIVERERFSAGVDAGMAGARATAAVLAALPLFGVALGQLIGADPVGFLLSDGVGEWLFAIGVALACAGLLWSERITDGVLR